MRRAETSQRAGRRGRRASLRRARIALGLLLGLYAGAALSLADDRLQAIEITAERAERNERRGYTIYSGAVVLTQGSLRIEADRLTIFHDREAADRIVASGEPAHMRQRPTPDKPFVVARGKRIVYERSRELITLRGAASIEQDGAVVTGESIRYFMAEQVVRADATPEDDNARVQVFIPAEVVEAASGDGDAPPLPGSGDAVDTPGAGDTERTVPRPDEDRREPDPAAETLPGGSRERGTPRSP